MLNYLDNRMPPPEVPLPSHKLLPQKTQEHLKHAAALDANTPPGESSLRTQAVEGAIATAKLKHPQFFRSKL